MNVNNLFWITPFLFFLGGYYLTSSLFHISTTEVPSVVGKQLDEAFSILSAHQLTIQLLDQKEESDLPDNTVVSQIPLPGQQAKQRQTVFLSLSKQPLPSIAPAWQGKQLADIEKEARTLKVRLKTYFLESVYPLNHCIAQIPMAAAPLPDMTMIVYISKGSTPAIIWPNFKNKPLNQVLEFLEHYNITPQRIDAAGNQPSSAAMVIDQRPLAGSIISLDDNHIPIVQLFTQ